MRVHRVPPMLKSADGSYRHETLPFGAALRERERIFATLVEDERPDVVVVDRHPYGTAGELRTGLDLARGLGSALVLGLRDVLDEPSIVREEMRGGGWADVENVYDDVLVYGRPALRRPRGRVRPQPSAALLRLGRRTTGAEPFGRQPPRRRGRWRWRRSRRLRDGRTTARAPRRPGRSLRPRPVRAAPTRCAGSSRLGSGRARVVGPLDACGRWFSRADAILCMAGYNSTLEALAAGRRPILMPRRTPRREQAIRADWLGGLGLAHVVEAGTDPGDVASLMQLHPRSLSDGALESAGIDLDGALNAARRLQAVSTARSVR